MDKYIKDGVIKTRREIILRKNGMTVFNPSEELLEKEGWKPYGEPKERYSRTVSNLIRERYSISDEMSILRQKDEKPEEWQEYYAYCEQCKKNAREKLGIKE